MDDLPNGSITTAQPPIDDLREAARALIPDLAEVAAVAGHPDIARISAPSGRWRVRRWPEGTSASDVDFSHDVMERARSAGMAAVPALLAPTEGEQEPVLRRRDRLFDAQRWMPGEPLPNAEAAWLHPDDRVDIPVVAPVEIFVATVGALARLHDATASLATQRGIPTAPLAMLPGAVRQAQGGHLSRLRSRARHEPAVQRWLATGERLLAYAAPLVGPATADRRLPESVLHLGLWPAHLLTEEGELTGLLGWERVAAGSPLLDLAQATLRLQGWHGEGVETAVGAYAAVRELAPEERRILPAVAALDAVATTGRLLELTYGGDAEGRPPVALRGAIEMMLASMSALDRDLNPATDAKRKRTWVRREGQPAHRPKGGKPRERRH